MHPTNEEEDEISKLARMNRITWAEAKQIFFVTVSPFEAEYLGVDNSYMMITNLKEIFLFTWGLIVGWRMRYFGN